MVKEKKWYEKPYSQTKKSLSETMTDIKHLLKKYSVDKYQETKVDSFISLRFMLTESEFDIPFEFNIYLPSLSQTKGEQKQRQYLRAYFYYLKSRMEILNDFKIKTFSEEFAQDRLLRLPNGQLRTIGQIIKDQKDKLNYAENLFLPFKEP